MAELTTVQIGVLSAVITELLKYIPFLNSNSLIKAVTSIVVCVVGALYFTGSQDYVQVILIAFATYKVLVQPIGQVVGIRTQA